MSQLTELTDFITAHLPPRVSEFDSWMDNQRLAVDNKSLGKGQQRIGVTTYDGVLVWEKWPYRECDPALLYSLLLVWMADGANELRSNRNLDDPSVDVETIDEEIAEVIITIPLIDELVIVPDENGEIPHNGQSWKNVAPLFDFAESAQIFGADSTGAEVDGSADS